jgi:4,5-DOPA dioxygenase extradiol
MNTDEPNNMPVLFIGHGNPMNALRDTPFTQTLNRWGRNLPRPTAILCVSAHWLTEGSWVTGMAQPRTIHDFYGFPQELYAVQYPAPGSPVTAELIRTTIKNPPIHIDGHEWGLDHGTWSVLRHMFPEAGIPVLQLSLDTSLTAEDHFKLGQQLKQLRRQGVLIIGSGNIVHNLRRISFDDNAPPLDWALEFDAWFKARLEDRNFPALLHEATQSASGKLSIPTPDHWLPLLYILGAANASDKLKTEYEGIENASISMRSFGFYL